VLGLVSVFWCCVLLVRVVRGLGVEEVLGRVRGFEGRFGCGFGEFEERFFRLGRPRGLVGVYLEWAGLVDAVRGYEESGELDYVVEEVREFSAGDVAALTVRRLELLGFLAGRRVESINELARRLGRDVKNVYEDLKALQKLGLVVLRRRGKRNIVPETLVEEITFLIR